jgi:uncharacterized protein
MFPKKLKNMNLFSDANSYLGVVAEVTLPKIVHQFEDWRGGGMIGAIKWDKGLETPEFEWTLGGLDTIVLRQMGISRHDGVLLRFLGAYQGDDGSPVTTLEAVIRGRHEELDLGGQKPGDDTETKVKTTCSYYKLTVNGANMIEIDLANSRYIVGGIDRYAEIRAAIGA